MAAAAIRALVIRLIFTCFCRGLTDSRTVSSLKQSGYWTYRPRQLTAPHYWDIIGSEHYSLYCHVAHYHSTIALCSICTVHLHNPYPSLVLVFIICIILYYSSVVIVVYGSIILQYYSVILFLCIYYFRLLVLLVLLYLLHSHQ